MSPITDWSAVRIYNWLQIEYQQSVKQSTHQTQQICCKTYVHHFDEIIVDGRVFISCFTFEGISFSNYLR